VVGLTVLQCFVKTYVFVEAYFAEFISELVQIEDFWKKVKRSKITLQGLLHNDQQQAITVYGCARLLKKLFECPARPICKHYATTTHANINRAT